MKFLNKTPIPYLQDQSKISMKSKFKNSSSSLKNNPSQERYNIIQLMSSIVDLMIHLYQTTLESLLNHYIKQLTH